jgi:hypothetical protein
MAVQRLQSRQHHRNETRTLGPVSTPHGKKTPASVSLPHMFLNISPGRNKTYFHPSSGILEDNFPSLCLGLDAFEKPTFEAQCLSFQAFQSLILDSRFTSIRPLGEKVLQLSLGS